MTDDEIIEAAKRILERRKNEKRLSSFESKETVMIRWDVPGATFGESYVGIVVSKESVADVVRAHYAPLIEKI